jgi:putative SOS response-associated peptidase YedK
MLWGMKRSVEGKGGIGVRLLINARSESVDSRPAFRESFRHRRCLVIADGFYEWKAMENHKQPYRIVLGSGQPFAFAGVWEETASGDRHFAILTTAADPSIRPIHDRMPVILSPSDHPLWLDTRQPDVGRFMHPDSNLALAAYAVSSAVNASRTNHPGLIEAAAEPVGRPDPSLFD